MTICAILGCSAKSERGVSLFGLPSAIRNQCKQTEELSEKRRAVWLARINRNFTGRKLNCATIKVCSRHFISGKPAYLFNSTDPDWAPSLHLGYEDFKVTQKVNRCLRAEARRNKIAAALRSSSSTKVTANIENNAPQNSPSNELPNLDLVKEEIEYKSESPEIQHVVNDSDQPSPSSDPCFTTPQLVWQVDVVELPKDVGCQTDLQNQEVAGLRAKIEDLAKNNNRLIEQSSYLSKQAIFLTVARNQELAELKAKIEDLVKNNNRLTEQNSSFSNKVNFLSVASEKLRSERDMLHKDNLSLRREVEQLKQDLKDVSLDETSLKGDDDKTKYYTGIPSYDLLKIVYDLVECELPHTHRNSLPKFSEFILAMMRLRLGCSGTDLGYRFNVSQSAASSICSRWFKGMSARLSSTITWPDRHELRRTTPDCFKDVFGDRFTVMLDFFELSIEKPSSKSARAEAWSVSKNHHTAKFLIGLTPQGKVCFISEAYGGRASNKQITIESGFLDKLQPGDVVLTDQGLDLDGHVGMRQAKSDITAFTKGETQLSFDNVKKTKEISKLRLLMDRAMGLLKLRFKILGGFFPSNHRSSASDGTPTADQVLKICCGLINLCPSLIREQDDLVLVYTGDDVASQEPSQLLQEAEDS
uniref:THAP-type domain-containing protein n=1 Tax=Lygus hesperus TaxID=30085 RepID=A0A146LDP2_LYGHE